MKYPYFSNKNIKPISSQTPYKVFLSLHNEPTLLWRFKAMINCQKKYVVDLIRRVGIENCKVVKTPLNTNKKLCLMVELNNLMKKFSKSIVGSLMYLTITTPVIVYVVCFISRYMHNPNKIHLKATKRIIRYIKGIMLWHSVQKKFKYSYLL